MADPDDDHDDRVVIDPIHDAVITAANAPSPVRPAQQLCARRAWIVCERGDRACDAAPHRVVQTFELTKG
jgi:hypothetical protein